MTDHYAEIAVELPLEHTFTYSVPESLRAEAALGKRALVPFGKRTVTGYITATSSKPPAEVKKIKPVIDILDDTPIFDAKRLEFYRWLSSYYFAPLGSVLALTHPAGANIKSFRHFIATPKGAEEAATKKGLDTELLSAASKEVSLSTLLKKFPGRPVHSALGRLKRDGLIEERLVLKGGGTRKTERVFTAVSPPVDPESLKRSPIQAKVYKRVLEDEVTMTELRREFGEVAAAVKKLVEKDLISETVEVVSRNPFSDIAPRSADFTPNSEQKAAIDAVTGAIGKKTFSPFLLYGVTGSGKTLVYLKALEEAVRSGKKAVILAPEIALTPWPAAYLIERFPGRVAIAHSGLSDGERLDEWRRVVRGEADIVVGARSALFSPIKDLGLIIVDEEHEASYKQDDGVRYNARDAALMLGKFLGITVVLGSATPSVETFYNARTGKLTLLTLKKRVEDRGLPAVELMDMKGRKGAVLSERLKDLLVKTLNDGHQALLFLNRRGFSNTLLCKDCGHSFSCLNCSVTLTVHKRKKALKCHYCDFTVPLPDCCPECSGINLAHPGAGTEKVEEEVRELLPGVRAGRMDRDTTSRKGSAKKIIDAVEERKLDILIGTQMVSKGHHFPGITLVGVVSGDTSLNIPDFRSSERTFQLITQAAGRAGRGTAAGTVVIQTLNTSHYCFKSAAAHDYESFYDTEISDREALGYPPFTRLCNLRVEGALEDKAALAADTLKKTAMKLLAGKDLSVIILGPAPALVTKIKNRYRWQMLVKSADLKTMHGFIRALKRSFESQNLR
ncbi:MAG TPA: primosomal protein N', partial [Thermodesulfobacteriota bacterium]|nr:primosomal protein N' [Thermodesulfobacteriota bacterium]